MRIADMKYQEEATLILVLSQPFDAFFFLKKRCPKFLPV